MVFQGVVKDADNVPYNGDFDVAVKICKDDEQKACPWNETFADVDIKDGVFALVLGSTKDLPADWTIPYYLYVSVAGNAYDNGIQIHSTPYALQAKTAQVATTVAAGAAVTKINGKSDAVLIDGLNGLSVSESGNTISISGPDLSGLVKKSDVTNKYIPTASQNVADSVITKVNNKASLAVHKVSGSSYSASSLSLSSGEAKISASSGGSYNGVDANLTVTPGLVKVSSEFNASSIQKSRIYLPRQSSLGNCTSANDGEMVYAKDPGATTIPTFLMFYCSYNYATGFSWRKM
jgi:hypothetical protein